MKIPIRTEVTAATMTAAAAISLTNLAESLTSGLIMSTIVSIAVFSSSSTSTIPIIKKRSTHSPEEILKIVAKIIANVPRPIWILKFLPVTKAVLKPWDANPKLFNKECFGFIMTGYLISSSWLVKI